MDNDLWNRVRLGDREAFLSLYEANYQHLFAFGCTVYQDKEQVKDCIHDVFCELWDKRLQLKEVSNTRAYLFTYLKRKLLKIVDSLKNIDQVSESFPEGKYFQLSYEELLINLQSNDEIRDKLAKVLAKLTKTQLEIIKLRFFEGLNYGEIATVLQLQPRSVYNMVYEGLKTMRRYMSVAVLGFIFALF